MKTSVQPGDLILPPLRSFTARSVIARTLAVILAGSLTVLSASAQTNVGDCVNAPVGLVSWWRGEGNALDHIHTNHGSMAGNVTTVAGKVGNGFGFDGTGYIVVPHHPSLNCSNALTIELWYKPMQSN